MTTPVCAECGKKLRRQWFTWWEGSKPLAEQELSTLRAFVNIESEPKRDRRPEPVVGQEVPGLGIVQRVKPGKPAGHLGRTVLYWTGRWGVHGCGHFCSAKCGFKFGLKRAKHEAEVRAATFKPNPKFRPDDMLS